MDFGKLPLFSVMAERLSWLGKRQQVLSQNIANADTPGYRAKDLRPQDFRALLNGTGGNGLKPVALKATQGGHIVPARASGSDPQMEKRDSFVSLAGNGVDLEDQTMLVTQTAMDHELIVNLYRKHLSMIRTAIGRPGG